MALKTLTFVLAIAIFQWGLTHCLLLTNAWDHDVYTGRHFDELVADGDGYVARNTLLLLYSPTCDAQIHRDVLNDTGVTDEHLVTVLKYDYVSTPKYVWYHMDSQDNLRQRYQPAHCMELLLFVKGTSVAAPTKRHEVSSWSSLSDVIADALLVKFTIVNGFGRPISILVEDSN